MGVECQVYLFPQDRDYRPNKAAIERLLDTWREANFLPALPFPAAPPDDLNVRQPIEGPKLKTSSGEIHVQCSELSGRSASQDEAIAQWSVDRSADLVHPLANIDASSGGTYYDLELHFATDFIEAFGEQIIFSDYQTECECGESLVYDFSGEGDDIFYAARIRRFCPQCGAAYAWSDGETICTDGITRAERHFDRGVAYRFAIVIDCGKCCYTTDGKAPTARSEFIEVCKRALAMDFDELAIFY